MNDFTRYLQQVADGFPSRRALAEALGISAPRLSHALSGNGGYTLNVENCLRLAMVANRPAAEVLRAAGKKEIADLLDHLYPRAGRPAVTGAERQLLDHWAALTDEEREAFALLMSSRVESRRHRQTG